MKHNLAPCRVILYIIVLCSIVFGYLLNGLKTAAKAESSQLFFTGIESTKSLQDSSADMESMEEPSQPPQSSVEPIITPEPDPGVIETPISDPVATTEPTSTPSVKRLGKVQGVAVARYSTHEVKISWKKQKKAKFYKVYCSRKKNGKYRCVGTTKKQHYLVRKLKNHKKYYFYVRACHKRKATDTDSLPSKKISIKTRTYSRKTIFAGDSICQGIAGWTIPGLHIGGQKKVVAYKGLNTVTYHTKRIFGGKTGLQKLIAEHPYRVYMMLGINEIHFRRESEMIREYEGMVRAIKQASPNTDIVLCAISPVTLGERSKRPGFHQIPAFNRHLKRMAEKNGVKYLDYTSFLKDSRGYLKGNYAQRDGYHWRPPAYQQFAKIIQKYDISQDR